MITHKKLKALDIKPSGRSTDFLTPSFIFGCGFNCSYCYCKRHVPKGLQIADNIDEILNAIYQHSIFAPAEVQKPNQTHDKYITYDIGCNTDVTLHYKHYDWIKVFDFFKSNDNIMGSFATKYVNEDLLNYNPESKMRIRFSLMPEKYRKVLEPNTSTIADRIKAINKFIEAGWDVHVNFSPVVVTNTWIRDYNRLFYQLDYHVKEEYKSLVKAEVIFLTHNVKKHTYNVDHNISGEDMLWRPDLQERKTSQYGGSNLRYKWRLKREFIDEWQKLHNLIIPWNTIRYIF